MTRPRPRHPRRRRECIQPRCGRRLPLRWQRDTCPEHTARPVVADNEWSSIRQAQAEANRDRDRLNRRTPDD